MATARYSALGTPSGNIAGTTLDGLGTGSTSAFMTAYANGTNLDLYGQGYISLASITPAVGGSITLRVFSGSGATAPDNTGSVGGGDTYTVPLTQGSSGKIVTIPLIRLYPQSLYFCVTNNAGVALGTGNAFSLTPFNETVT